MSIRDDGFFSPEIGSWIKRIRSENQGWFFSSYYKHLFEFLSLSFAARHSLLTAPHVATDLYHLSQLRIVRHQNNPDPDPFIGGNSTAQLYS